MSTEILNIVLLVVAELLLVIIPQYVFTFPSSFPQREGDTPAGASHDQEPLPQMGYCPLLRVSSITNQVYW